MNIWLQLLIQTVLSFAGTVGYSLCINIPRRALIACGYTGALGWIVYWILYNFTMMGHVLANFIAAVAIGLISQVLAKRKRMPVILFNIPGLIPLVPGATAYQAVREMVLGKFNVSLEIFIRVALVIGAIAVGYMVAQVLIDIEKRSRRWYTMRMR